MKVLVMVPPQNKPGGISTYYNSLKNHFSSDIEYFERGNRSEKRGLRGYLDYLNDYWRFFQILRENRFERFLLNTSLAKSNAYRDFLFMFMILSFKKECIIFFHGWDIKYQNELDQNLGFQRYPFSYLRKASHFIILSESFSIKLREWGFKKRITVNTTAVEDHYFNSNLFDKLKFKSKLEPFHFLFLSRIEYNKGALDAVNLFSTIQKSYHDREIKLIVAGSGSALQPIKDYVFQSRISNVEFVGFISGNEKVSVFKKSHFFIFPSSQEGLPIALLEAMCFGLPIFCIATGGIKDFFQNDKMGIIQTSLDILSGATQIIELLDNPNRMIEIGRFNNLYSKEHFLASDIARKLENIIKAEFYG